MNVELTPVLNDQEREQSRRLSLENLRPPIRVPGYQDEKFLGRGAFGEVWVASDRNSGRRVAIKFYNRRGGLDWSLLSREVEKLRHLFTDRHVVQLLAVGWDADPPYYIMEFMENGSLEDRLQNGPLTVPEALPLWHDIAVGLVHAHGRGILHCDLKPANILLDQDRKPRLADFGQARLTNESSPALGTLFYMAPEQADLNAGPDVRWDVYALGAVLYCMLTGSPPYRTDEAVRTIHEAGTLERKLECYREVLHESPRPTGHRSVEGVDAALAEIVERCLALSPRERYPNVQAVLSALQARGLRKARRPLLILGTMAPALVLLVMAVAGWWLFDSAVRTSRKALRERALESNRFAAQAVARQVGLEIAQRWQVLQEEAARKDLQQWLLQRQALPDDSPVRQDLDAKLQDWLCDCLQRHNAHFDDETPARSWFLNNRDGIQVARLPHDPKTVGESWVHRDYFHGRGVEYDPDHLPTPRPTPDRVPRVSLVFRSGATNLLSVAFTVPIWEHGPGDGDPIGILGIAVDLGRLAELRGSQNQFPVLLDTRDARVGRSGLVIEHPAFQDNTRALAKQDHYAATEVVVVAERVRESGEPADIPGDYADPVLGSEAGQWLATLYPVVVHSERNRDTDTGWVVVIQERSADALRPLDTLTSRLVYGGVLALVTAVVLVTALWGLVVFVLEARTGSRLATFLRRRVGLPSSSASGASARHSGATGTPAAPPTPAPTERDRKT